MYTYYYYSYIIWYSVYIEFHFQTPHKEGDDSRARIRQELAVYSPWKKCRITVDQNLSLLQYRRPYPASHYFGIGEKNIIKFNGPSGCGIATPGAANKYREQGGYKSQDKQEPVFFYPLDFRRAFSEPMEKGSTLPFLHSSYELLGDRT